MEDPLGGDRVLEQYDYVVIGSGFTALAFIDETLRLCPDSKILCIERGDDNYAAHYERLLQHSRRRPGHSRAVPDVVPDQCSWHLSFTTSSSEELNTCAGTCFLFGGRSNYWYGWCMKPTLKQMRGYPAVMTEATADPDFWTRASELLGMISIDQLGASWAITQETWGRRDGLYLPGSIRAAISAQELHTRKIHAYRYPPPR
jgi:hypothetical protein